MRHKVYGRKLNRNKNERTALFKSLAQELFLHGTITTTESKAKSIKGLVDKIINCAKGKDSQRLLQSYFTSKVLQDRLIKEIVPKLGGRTSGYTSLMKMGIREGDRSIVVKMSIIGVEKLKPIKKESKESEESKVTKVIVPVKKVVPKKPVTERKTIKK